MKMLATNDIHQMSSKWKELVKVCEVEKPEVLIIAGDLFPHDNGILKELDFVKHLKKYAKKIKDYGIEIVLTLGNDDNQLLITEMENGHDEGLWNYVNNQIFEMDGYEFAGMSYVPDYPFGYKFWCHPEFKDDLKICYDQYGDPLIVNENNEFEIIPNLKEYMESKISIYDALIETASMVNDIKKSIWLIHAPPAGMGLDVCSHGARVGSNAVLKFIEEYQPLLTIHGHIHESPEYNGKKWKQYCSETLCVQGGQMGFDIYYSLIELEDGEIKSTSHSEYSK